MNFKYLVIGVQWSLNVVSLLFYISFHLFISSFVRYISDSKVFKKLLWLVLFWISFVLIVMQLLSFCHSRRVQMRSCLRPAKATLKINTKYKHELVFMANGNTQNIYIDIYRTYFNGQLLWVTHFHGKIWNCLLERMLCDTRMHLFDCWLRILLLRIPKATTIIYKTTASLQAKNISFFSKMHVLGAE